MVDKIINNIKLPNGEVYAIGGDSRFGLKGDYSTHYGIEYCQHGLIDNPVGTTNIIVKGGMMLCLPGADTKTTIGSDITYSITSLTDVTIFYADGNILEAGKVHYSLTEPADNGIENYIAWWNPDFGKWQFKSNDTGNVWREAIATPIADIRIEEGNIVRIDYIGYRLLNDDIYGLKSETADIDLNNLTEDGEKHFLNKSQITNCLLEIPQRVKLELNDGVLTLKAGSQVIVPNGFKEDGVTPRFDYVDIESDLILTSTWGTSEPVYVYFSLNDRAIAIGGTARFSSGTTAPTLTNAQWWYDTTTNFIKRYSNASDTGSRISFPIAICTKTEKVENNLVASVEKVFNGLGYIGSTVWVDKGVKGLIPNGRNEDGSLKNIEFTTSKVFTETATWASNNIIFSINSNGIGRFFGNDVSYNEYENFIYFNGSKIPHCFIGTFAYSNGITSFNPKQPFRAVDWNDLKDFIRIGQPQLSLDSVLPADCVWLEGATVSRTTYASLFAIYGTTYGAGDGSTTFVLPDFRNRAIWGSNGFGYISAGLPNITGTTVAFQCRDKNSDSGALWTTKNGTGAGTSGGGNTDRYISFNASRSNSIYGASTTVQPPAIKVRVYARYQ